MLEMHNVGEFVIRIIIGIEQEMRILINFPITGRRFVIVYKILKYQMNRKKKHIKALFMKPIVHSLLKKMLSIG